MPGRQAKTLSAADVNDLLVFASCTRNPLRNRVIVLLSAKAGLRAGEIANLTWDMVLGPAGQIGNAIELYDIAAQSKSNRVIRSERGSAMTASSIVVWFNRTFKSVGLKGCSSHSGRRTF